MDTKIAILRGINVGGERKILMADLKSLCEQLGMKEVKTYTQSGNIIFKSTDYSENLENKLENSIMEEFGIEVPVIVRTSAEFQELIDKNPFYNASADIHKLHLTLLKERPTTESIKQMETYNYEVKIKNRID